MTQTSLRPGAEPYSHDGGSVGVLLCHGFTGAPGSLLDWAKALAAVGLTVRLPRLPGHGTTWQQMNRTGWTDWYGEVESTLLGMTTSPTFVMGLSMGGTLALRLAEQHPDRVAGLVLVNPSLHSDNKALTLLPLLKHLVPSLKGVSNDIKKPGVTEPAYDRLPLKALASLVELWRLTTADLNRVSVPVLVYRSAVDHVVEPSNARTLLAGISSPAVEEVVLADSYHVATMDNDAERIFAGSLRFVREHT